MKQIADEQSATFYGGENRPEMFTLFSNLSKSTYEKNNVKSIKFYFFIFYSHLNPNVTAALGSPQNYTLYKHYDLVIHFGKLIFVKIESEFVGKVYLNEEFSYKEPNEFLKELKETGTIKARTMFYAPDPISCP